MNQPPPPPFGDPANIQRENAAAVRKGVGVGCGIIAALVMAGIGMIAGIFFLVMFILRSQEPCVQTLKLAQASPIIRRELGEPISMGWIITGSIRGSGNNGTASVTIEISGPKGNATVHTMGNRQEGVWTYREMLATLAKTGKQVDLRPSQNR